MYRKDADRLIVRDICQRLDDMRQAAHWVDWRVAVVASRSEHEAWYRHHEPRLLEGVEQLLRNAGVDTTVRFVGTTGAQE